MLLKGALISLVIAVVAALLSLGGIASGAMTIAWILFAVFLVPVVINFITGRSSSLA